MRPIFLLLFCCFLPFLALGQETQFKKHDPASLKNDLDSLRKTVLKTHQNPYTYCTKKEFDNAYEYAKNQITDSLNTYEFAGLIAEFLGTIQDSHTYLNYNFLRSKYQAESGLVLDFSIEKIADKYIVTKDKNELIPIGSSIDSINGIAMEDLHSRVQIYSIREGNSITANQRITTAIFGNTVGYITPIYGKNELVFTDSLLTKRIEYPGKDYNPQKKTKRKRHRTPSFVLTIDTAAGKQMAIMKIGSFSASNNRKFYQFLKKSFRTIKQNKIEFLAIDLRNNLGGQVVRTDMLMAYLTEESAYIPNNIIAKQSDISKKMYRHKINPFQLFFLRLYPFKNQAVKNYINQVKMKTGEIDTLYYNFPNPYVSKKLQFHGKSLLIINGLSGSASVLFASAYRKEILDGLIVGEPCLGPITGTWGNPGSYFLKNSELQVFISTIRTNLDDSFHNDPNELTPDYWVPNDVNSIKKQRDAQLEFVKQLIIDSNKQTE